MGNIVGWRDASRYSKYPFSEASSLRSSSGWELPGGAFADAQVRLPHGSDGAFLSSLEWSGSGLLGQVSSGKTVIGSFAFAEDDLDGGSAEILNSFGRSCGTIVAGEGSAEELRTMPGGRSNFAAADAAFEVTTLFVYPQQALRFIRIGDVEYAGRLVLVEGPGITLVRENRTTVRFDAIGDPSDLDDCARATSGPALKTINSVGPDAYGNFGIEPGDYATPTTPTGLRQILKITPGDHFLTFGLAR